MPTRAGIPTPALPVTPTTATGNAAPRPTEQYGQITKDGRPVVTINGVPAYWADTGRPYQPEDAWDHVNNFVERYGPYIVAAGAAPAVAPLFSGGAGAGAGGAAAGGGTAAVGPTLGTAATTGAGVSGTGGFLGSIGGVKGLIDIAGKVGNVASNAAQGRAEGRTDEANYLLGRDRNALLRAQISRNDAFRGADLDIERRKTAATLDTDNLKKSLELGLLAGNSGITAPAHIASRMATSNAGPQSIQGRDEIIAALRPRIMDALEKGQQFAPLTLEDLPELGTPPKPSGIDTALNAIGTIGTIGGIFGSKPISNPLQPPPDRRVMR